MFGRAAQAAARRRRRARGRVDRRGGRVLAPGDRSESTQQTRATPQQKWAESMQQTTPNKSGPSQCSKHGLPPNKVARAHAANTGCTPTKRPESPRIVIVVFTQVLRGRCMIVDVLDAAAFRPVTAVRHFASRVCSPLPSWLRRRLPFAVPHPHNMDYPRTRWPKSPRIVMRCAPRASNGPNHLGLCAPPESLLRTVRAFVIFAGSEVRHGLQLQSLWIIPTLAVS